MIIKVAKKIFNSSKICRSYSDLNFGVTFLEHSVLATNVQIKRANGINGERKYAGRRIHKGAEQ